MPHETPHSHEPADLNPSGRFERDTDSRSAPLANPIAEPPTSGAAGDALPRFSLLADPATISGEAPSRRADADREDEVARLRSALHARSREVAALARQQAPPPQSEAVASAPSGHASTKRKDGLLNASEARRLAEEAQAREKACRIALASARDELRRPEPEEPSGTAPSAPGWQRRALAMPPTPASESPRDPDPSPAIDPPDRTPVADRPPESQSDPAGETLAAVQAELRDLRSQLAIALETSAEQKREIAELGARLSARAGSPAPEATRAESSLPAFESAGANERTSGAATEIELSGRIEALETERRRLEERLALNEREIDARDAERALLRQTLEERESELARYKTRIEALEDRLEVQGQALENTRRQVDRERRLNTKSREILSRLREVLGDDRVPDLLRDLRADSPPDLSLDRANDLRAEAALLDPMPPRAAFGDEAPPLATTGSLDGKPDESRDEPLEVETRTSRPTIRNALALDASRNRKAVFDAWQDDQIRRHFGPMGIDSLADLLREPLARRVARNPAEQRIVLLGRGASTGFRSLVDGLVQNGSPDFLLFVGDPLAEDDPDSGRIPADSPFRDFVETLDAPRNPGDLDRLLSEIDPTALVLCDFLSAQEQVAPWLEILARFSERGGCLLFSESTGIDPLEAPDEVADIGDRIWGLMPKRYTLVEGLPGGLASWREAFENLPERPANELLTELRRSFRLDMLAQFGFLVEPFLGPIASNFDPRAARDRRFLGQIADLDDRKIEAGLAPPLHLVALVDPLIET